MAPAGRPVRTARWYLRYTAAPLTAFLLVAGCSSTAPPTTPPTNAPAGAATAKRGAAPEAVLTATKAFLGTLDDTQKAAVTAKRTPANLAQWSNLPNQVFTRAGLRMDSLDRAQQDAVLAILRAALSPEGYAQVAGVRAGDDVWAAQHGPAFGAGTFFVRILGTPAATGKWTVQFGGHHLAINATMDGKDMTLAPTLWGAEPAVYDTGGGTAEPLRGETVKAFTLMEALDADQQKAATLTTPVVEFVLGPGQDGKTLAPEGVQASTFTDAQKKLLLDLVDEWITPLNPEEAAAKLAAVQQNLDRTTFAWSGPMQIGKPIYYRVQGPTFTIEFAHEQGQGGQGGGIQHIHAIYREPGNDYGAQLTP